MNEGDDDQTILYNPTRRRAGKHLAPSDHGFGNHTCRLCCTSVDNCTWIWMNMLHLFQQKMTICDCFMTVVPRYKFMSLWTNLNSGCLWSLSVVYEEWTVSTQCVLSDTEYKEFRLLCFCTIWKCVDHYFTVPTYCWFHQTMKFNLSHYITL